MNWFKAIVWIKGIKILLVIIIDYISFKDSFGYKKFNFVFISHFYLIAAENIFIQTAESTCILNKITNNFMHMEVRRQLIKTQIILLMNFSSFDENLITFFAWKC